MLAAEVERLPTFFGANRGRFVHLHVAYGIYGHRDAIGLMWRFILLELNRANLGPKQTGITADFPQTRRAASFF
jgi:hypothetical protein